MGIPVYFKHFKIKISFIKFNSTLCHRFLYIGNKIFNRSDALSLPNGINLELYQYDCKKEYRRLFNIPDEAFVVGHVGRFIKVKNHPLILRSFAELKKIRANSKLILVGEGDDMDAIRCLSKDLGVENDVVFTGARSDVPKLMRMFDVFILKAKNIFSFTLEFVKIITGKHNSDCFAQYFKAKNPVFF